MSAAAGWCAKVREGMEGKMEGEGKTEEQTGRQGGGRNKGKVQMSKRKGTVNLR